MHGSGSTLEAQHLPWLHQRAVKRFQIDREGAGGNRGGGERLFVRHADPAPTAPPEVSFGPFRLLTTQFLLLEGETPVPLGSRALEILIALLERPGELITKQELMARVWPDVFVEPNNLTVHISALRRSLRDGRDGNRIIINIPGRGYMFVAPIQEAQQQKAPLELVSRKTLELEERGHVPARPHHESSNVRAFPSGRAAVV